MGEEPNPFTRLALGHGRAGEEKMKKVALAIVAPVLVLAGACGGDKKPAAAPAPQPTAEPTPVTSAPAEKESATASAAVARSLWRSIKSPFKNDSRP